ncbi:hypothetical protein Rs2_04164 [Raphanus sativus]|nr:hypothetical protein Rs2_04164 [Raphanus sativus]
MEQARRLAEEDQSLKLEACQLHQRVQKKAMGKFTELLRIQMWAILMLLRSSKWEEPVSPLNNQRRSQQSAPSLEPHLLLALTSSATPLILHPLTPTLRRDRLWSTTQVLTGS